MTMLGTACMLLAAPAVPGVRVGVYWWDAWWEGSPYIREPLITDYADREPVYGWRSDSREAMSQAVDWLASAHIDFISFLWYERGAWKFDDTHPSDLMDTGLDLYLASEDTKGVGFSIMWTQPVATDHLDAVIDEWMGYFRDPRYVRIGGKPVLHVYADVLDKTPGGDEALRAEIAGIKAAAEAAGLPGVYLVSAHWDLGATDRYRALGLDAVSSYVNFGGEPGANPYSVLVKSVQATWDASPTAMPYVPNVTSGWDPRPRMGYMNIYDRWFEDRTPELLEGYVASALDWIGAHPDRVPTEPLLTIYAWNEVDEGGWLVPTTGERTTMLDAVGKAIEGASRSR